MADIHKQPLHLQNILCIRADNMGDLLMSTPALRALKETFHCKITVLTSAMGSLITPYIKEIDDIIVADVPWVKTDKPLDEIAFVHLVQTLTSRAFDAAIIFTVYSQNPLPAAMLAMLAGIDIRVAYCRENPYRLLSHWLPDEEPYTFIQHQVERDLKLAASVGATVSSKQLSVYYHHQAKGKALQKLADMGADTSQPFIIFHPGVSEEKRKYPVSLWTEAGRKFLQNNKYQIIITGSQAEEKQALEIQGSIGVNSFAAAGLLSVEELIAVIDSSQLTVSVNTGTVHIAAALSKPVVVLYALTNPQHTPWMTASKVLYFSVQEELQNKNQIIRYVSEKQMPKKVSYPSAQEVCDAIDSLLHQ